VTDITDTPYLVQRAYAAARRIGFPVSSHDPGYERGSASIPGTGRFLAVLAASCLGGRIAEMGTGAGIGAAWIASSMPADCELITFEIDPARAAAAVQVLAEDSRVRVIGGDAAAQLAQHGPYDLIFADSGAGDPEAFSGLVSLLRPGGRIVMDDVTPVAARPPDSQLRQSDVKRELFATEQRLTWTEVVLPDLINSLLVGTRGIPM
jgi:predicted O-methyltransferase YrrM